MLNYIEHNALHFTIGIQAFAAGMYCQDKLSWAKDTTDKIECWLKTAAIAAAGIPLIILAAGLVIFCWPFKWIYDNLELGFIYKYILLRRSMNHFDADAIKDAIKAMQKAKPRKWWMLRKRAIAYCHQFVVNNYKGGIYKDIII